MKYLETSDGIVSGEVENVANLIVSDYQFALGMQGGIREGFMREAYSKYVNAQDLFRKPELKVLDSFLKDKMIHPSDLVKATENFTEIL